ncbi:hypothetical protein Hanom_Chr12g01076021 [Helianthus anomalus]
MFSTTIEAFRSRASSLLAYCELLGVIWWFLLQFHLRMEHLIPP